MWHSKKSCAAVVMVCAFLFWVGSVAVAQTSAIHRGHHGYYSEDVGTNNHDGHEGDYENHHTASGANHHMGYGDSGEADDGHATHHGVDGYHGHGSGHSMGYGSGYMGYGHRNMGRSDHGRGGGC